jgi:hypothetical protein
MNYLKFPLDYQTTGAIVQTTLEGVESDVFVVDAPNLSSFERGGNFRYVGGHYTSSPVRLVIPSPGTWTVVVVPGTGGTVSAGVKIVAAGR